MPPIELRIETAEAYGASNHAGDGRDWRRGPKCVVVKMVDLTKNGISENITDSFLHGLYPVLVSPA